MRQSWVGITLAAHLIVAVFLMAVNYDSIRLYGSNQDATPRNIDLGVDLFIAIPSTATHRELRDVVRSTWLQRCNMNAKVRCKYAFFLDDIIPAESEAHTQMLQEDAEFKDIVLYRNSCTILQRHSHNIHYKNYEVRGPSHPILFRFETKMCIMSWIMQELQPIPQFILIVEDDSYLCTDNLLHQLYLLQTATSGSTYTSAANNTSSAGWLLPGE
jgi:hypothetical protein